MDIKQDDINGGSVSVFFSLCGYLFFPTIMRLVIPAGSLVFLPGRSKGVDIEHVLWEPKHPH